MSLKVLYKTIRYSSKHRYLKRGYVIHPGQYRMVFAGGISSLPIHFKL